MENIVKNKIKFEINTSKTKVLLIGVSEYAEDSTISNIPNIKQNIKLFKQVLLNVDIIGVPKENILISLNESKKSIERKLINVARETYNEDFTLLVYYTGHGILSSENFKLYLTSKESSKDYLETDSINIDRFREILTYSRAASKIVILDACHSGQIHNTMNNIESTLNSEIKKFEGTYIMTSASEDNPSLFPHKNTKQPTYFTAKMIDVFTNGVENGKPYISIRDVYSEIYKCFKNQNGLPLPQQSIFKDADGILVAKNQKFGKNNFSKEHFNYENKRDKMFDKDKNKTTFLRQKNFINLKKVIIISSSIIILISGIVSFNVIKTINSKNNTPIVISCIAINDTIVKKREVVKKEKPNPVNNKANNYIYNANILYANGETNYDKALKLYIKANNTLGGNENVQRKIRNLSSEIDSIYNQYLENAKIYLQADEGKQEALDALNYALILKPNDTVALNKIKQIVN